MALDFKKRKTLKIKVKKKKPKKNKKYPKGYTRTV